MANQLKVALIGCGGLIPLTAKGYCKQPVVILNIGCTTKAYLKLWQLVKNSQSKMFL